MAVGGASGSGGKGVKAGKAYVEVGIVDAGLRAGLAKAKQMVLGFGKSLLAGGGMLAGLGGSITTPILGFFTEATSRVTKFRKAAEQLGSSTEVMSALGYAAEKAGVDLEGLVNASRKVQRNIADAAAGEKGAADAFKRLGIDAKNLIGLPLDEQFMAIADGLAMIEDPTKKQAAAFDVLGRAGVQLLPIFARGSEGLREFMEEGKDLGAIVKTEDAERTKVFTKALGQAKNAVRFLWEEIGLSILPLAERFADWAKKFTKVIGQIREMAEKNRPLIASIFLVAGAIGAAGTAFVGIGTAIFMASVAISGFATLIGGVVTVVSTIAGWAPVIGIVLAVAAAVAGLFYVLYKFTSLGGVFDKQFAVIKSAFSSLVSIGKWAFAQLSLAWEGLQAAFATGDMEGAIEVAKLTLNVFWRALRVGAQASWNFVKEKALGVWDDIVGFAEKALVDIDTELKLFGTNKKEYLLNLHKQIVKAYVDGWKKAYKMQLDMAKAAIEGDWKMRKWIMNNWKSLLAGAVGISGLGTVLGAQKKGVEHAATQVAEGEALAKAVGEKTAQELIKEKGEQLKAEIDRKTAAKKAARSEQDAAKLAEEIEALKAAEKELADKVLELKRKAAAAEEAKRAKDVQDVARMAMRRADAAVRASAIAAVGELGRVRGQFGGGGAGASLAISGDVEQKQLDELERIRKAVEEAEGGGIEGF